MTINTSVQISKKFNVIVSRRACVVQLALVVVCCIIAVGCNPHPKLQQPLQTYSERLANVLDAEPPSQVSAVFSDIALATISQPAHYIAFHPILSKVKSPPPATNQSLSLREFQQLPNCHQLKPIIAQQNSSLGRVQSPSQYYLYQIEVVSLLTQCINHAENNSLPKSQLTRLYQAKIQDLTNSRHWFLRTTPGIRRSLAFSATLLEPNWKQHQQTIRHWQTLVSSPSATSEFPVDLPATMHSLNSALRNLEANPFPSQLYNTLNWYSFQIGALNTWLQAHLSNENCRSAQAKTRVEYLENIMTLFFINDIQIQGSKLSQLHYRLHPVVQQLYATPLADTEMSKIVSEHQIIFERYQNSMKSHAIIWSEFFKRCHSALGR